ALPTVADEPQTSPLPTANDLQTVHAVPDVLWKLVAANALYPDPCATNHQSSRDGASSADIQATTRLVPAQGLHWDASPYATTSTLTLLQHQTTHHPGTTHGY